MSAGLKQTQWGQLQARVLKTFSVGLLFWIVILTPARESSCFAVNANRHPLNLFSAWNTSLQVLCLKLDPTQCSLITVYWPGLTTSMCSNKPTCWRKVPYPLDYLTIYTFFWSHAHICIFG